MDTFDLLIIHRILKLHRATESQLQELRARNAREVIKEDGEEDPECPVYTEGRKAS